MTLPNATPWTAIGAKTQPMRWELRIHDVGVQWPGTGFVLASPVELYQNDIGNWLSATNMADPPSQADTFVGTNGPTLSGCCMGRTDLLLRVQRDVANSQWTIEVYDTIGGNYLSGTAAIAAFGPVSWAGKTINVSSGENVAFVRWFSSVVPLGTPIPITATGDLGDWEFEGNLTDSSGHGLTMSGGTFSFVPTPTYPPACSAGKPQSFRAGHPGALDGTGSAPLDGGATLTYLWQQLSGPAVTWGRTPTPPPIIGRAGLAQWTTSDQDTAQPVISGLAPGSYTFQLTVTDSSGHSSVCTVNDGAVETDNNGLVITNNPAVDTLLGPMVQYGANPWPWYDDRHKAEADMQIADMDPYYGAWWNVADTGTVAVTQGSTTIVGTGTTFKATFCGGGTSPVNSIVVWYPNADLAGDTGRRIMAVVSCQSDTELTTNNYWPIDLSAGTTLSYSDDSNSGTWAYNAAPANYYDNVAALYALYYRSGLVAYLNAARKLADRFWEAPNTDRGQAYVLDPNGAGAWQWRSSSVMGLVLRGLDGRPEMWTGIEKIAAFANYELSPGSYQGNFFPSIYDVRETAYKLAILSYCALYDTNSAGKATCQSDLVPIISTWFTNRRCSDGSWRDFYGTYDLATSVALSHGSTAVTGTGTSWTSDQFASSSGYDTVMWFTPSPSVLPTSNSGGDSTFYTPSWVDGTHLMLDRPYEGTTGTHGWVVGSADAYPIVGYGALPYMEGLLAEAFDLAAKALATSSPATSAMAYGYSLDAARWIMNNGYRESTKSVYYAAGYVNCQLPIPEENNLCTNNYDPDSARVISTEAIGGIARAYGHSNDASLKAFADVLFNAIWAKPTTCPTNSTVCIPDGYYGLSWDDGQWYMTGTPPVGKAPKWFGQMAGFPGLSSWPAIRLGGPQPAVGQVFYIGLNFAAVPGAVTARVTTTAADGTDLPVECASSPCAVTAYGQGDRPAKLEYLSHSGAVLASSQIALTQAQ